MHFSGIQIDQMKLETSDSDYNNSENLLGSYFCQVLFECSNSYNLCHIQRKTRHVLYLPHCIDGKAKHREVT